MLDMFSISATRLADLNFVHLISSIILSNE